MINYNNPDLKAQFDRGYQDAHANKPAYYGCHFDMRSTRESWCEAYHRGYEQGRRDLLGETHRPDEAAS